MLKDPQPPCQPDCMSRSSGPRARTKNRSRQKLTRVARAENIRRQPNPALYICCPITFTFWFPAPARWFTFHPPLMFYAPYATEKDIGSPPAPLNMPRLIDPASPTPTSLSFQRPQTTPVISCSQLRPILQHLNIDNIP